MIIFQISDMNASGITASLLPFFVVKSCSGDAVCVVEDMYARCVCPPDRTGALCEQILGACHTKPCETYSIACEDGGSTHMADIICTCMAGEQ